jgi:hypothetical protein
MKQENHIPENDSVKNNSTHINGIVESLLVVNLFVFICAAIVGGYNLLQDPMEFVPLEIIICISVYVVYRLLDNCRWALIAYFVLLLISVIYDIIINPNASVLGDLGLIAMWVLLFFLPKNGKTSYRIILESPQTNKVEQKDIKALIIIYSIIAVAIIVGIVRNW